MEQSQQKIAPGLYAELGTLYLQAGDSTKAVAMYAKEREAWPESRYLMDSLINNVAKRSGATGTPRRRNSWHRRNRAAGRK